jgi:hypothetical protein
VVIWGNEGAPAPLDPEMHTPPVLGQDRWNWGSPSRGATRLAWIMLATTVGTEIAGALAIDFAGTYLARQQRQGFFATAEEIEQWVCAWVVTNAEALISHASKGGKYVIPF